MRRYAEVGGGQQARQWHHWYVGTRQDMRTIAQREHVKLEASKPEEKGNEEAQ